MLKKTSQMLATILLISVFVPVLAFAASTLEITQATYNNDGTISGTVYSSVYDQDGIVSVAVYSDADATTPIPNSIFTAVYDPKTTVNGVTYLTFKTDSFHGGAAASSVYLKPFNTAFPSVTGGIYTVTIPAVTPGQASIVSLGFNSIGSFFVGNTVSSVVYATYSDGTKPIVTPFATFSSNNTSVATVDAAGVISGVSIGSTVINATYNGFAASTTVSVVPRNTSSGSSSSGGGGGGPVSTDGTISVNSDGTISSTTLLNALASNSTVTLKLSGDSASLPASALVDGVKAGKTIVITNNNGSYILPLSVLKLEDLAASLGVELKDLSIKVSISKASNDALAAAAAAVGGTAAANAVDFNVTAVGKDGKTASVSFGGTYVSRTLNTTKAVNSSKATGVLYNDTTKKVSFVPSTFESKDGNTIVTLKRNGNSIYSVIELNKSFADLSSHWAKADVELLANKLVVDGATDTAFQPDRNITRAEFAALVVRSLGLSASAPANSFKDVNTSAWYASIVATAVNAGIINGYEDNTFRPDAPITREELTAMVIRAMNYAGISTSVSDPQSVLSKYKDAKNIVWAQKEIAAAINAGLINGLTDDTIGSNSQATRAQSATMLKRFLITAKFIN